MSYKCFPSDWYHFSCVHPVFIKCQAPQLSEDQMDLSVSGNKQQQKKEWERDLCECVFFWYIYMYIYTYIHIYMHFFFFFHLVQLLSHVWLFEIPLTAACQASLSITNSWIYSNSCPLSRWCHPTISSSVIPFSYCPQSFPASGSFQMSQLFASGGQSIGVSASVSVLPVNTQDWSP